MLLFSQFKDALSILNAYKTIMEFGSSFKRITGILKNKFYDINEVYIEICRGNIKFGDVIRCTGFLSKYSQTFKPISYIPTVTGSGVEKLIGLTKINGFIQQKMQLEVTMKSLQIPVKIIPPFENKRLCFLYRDDFNSFVYPINDGSSDVSLKGKIMIPESGKPIPVIIDKNQTHFMDKYVNINAKIDLIPIEHIEYFKTMYDNIMLEHNNNFFNPLSEKCPLYCLNVMTENTDTKIELVNKQIPDPEAQIFIELHIDNDGVDQKKMNSIINKSIPDLASDKIYVIKNQNIEATPYITKGDITVIYKEPNIIGLYTIIKLFDDKIYAEKIDELHQYVIKLSRNIQSESMNQIGKQLHTKTDFIFDPSKADFFDSRGILRIDLADKMYNDIIKWYKNKQ